MIINKEEQSINKFILNTYNQSLSSIKFTNHLFHLLNLLKKEDIVQIANNTTPKNGDIMLNSTSSINEIEEKIEYITYLGSNILLILSIHSI